MKLFLKKHGKEIMMMALFMMVFLVTPAYASEYAQKFQSESLSIIASVLMVMAFYTAVKLFSKGMTIQAIGALLGGVVLLGIIAKPEILNSVGQSFIDKIF